MWTTRYQLDLRNSTKLPSKYPTRNLWSRDTIINEERQYYADPNKVPDIFIPGDQGLTVRARRRLFEEEYTEQEWISGMFTSFGVDKAQLDPSFRERIVFKVRLPVGVGAWPACWLLPVIDPPNWPADEPVLPELDAMEYLSHDPHIYYATVHTRDNPQGTLNSDQYEHNCPQIVLPDEFHTWGYERNAQTSHWWFDGEITKTFVTPADLIDRELFFLVNLAIGGSWSEQWSDNWPPTAQRFQFQIAEVVIERWENPVTEEPATVPDIDLSDDEYPALTPGHANYDIAKGVERDAARYCECIQREALKRIKELS